MSERHVKSTLVKEGLINGSTIRPATEADVRCIAQLRLDSGWAGGADEERMRRYLAGEHNPQQARAPRAAFVAEADGEMTGFIAGHLTNRFGCDGELQWILVSPAHRGGTTASRLLSSLALWFSRQGAKCVCVNVETDNARARRFYARRGALELSDGWMVWPDVSVAAQHAEGPTPR